VHQRGERRGVRARVAGALRGLRATHGRTIAGVVVGKALSRLAVVVQIKTSTEAIRRGDLEIGKHEQSDGKHTAGHRYRIWLSCWYRRQQHADGRVVGGRHRTRPRLAVAAIA
jgi:hypothetical protein